MSGRAEPGHCAGRGGMLRLLLRPVLCCCILFACLLSAVTESPAAPLRMEGEASWYGEWHHGKETATGAPFDMFSMTAAHKDVPLGTLVRVGRLPSGPSIIVRINDRGPYHGKRMLDLSYAAADRLGVDGVARVSMEAVSDAKGRLLDRGSRLYVRLRPGTDRRMPPERCLERLIRSGLRTAPSLLRDDGTCLALGPFRDFQEAQRMLVRIGTIFPEASIMTAKAASMRAVVKSAGGRKSGRTR